MSLLRRLTGRFPQGPTTIAAGLFAAAAVAYIGEQSRRFASRDSKASNSEEGSSNESSLEVKCQVFRCGPAPIIWPPGASFASGITEIDLSGCGLEALPESIGELSGLRKLNAAHNSLASLPESFGNLRELRVLFFLGCKFEEVPPLLGRLPKLFMLSFKANRLRRVLEGSLAPSVGWLILSDNAIAELPRSVGQLKGLRKLMLAGNQLVRLPEELTEGCKELELVRLADNKLAELPTKLLALPKLAWVALAHNDFNLAHALRARVRAPPMSSRHTLTVRKGQAPLGKGASGVVFRGTLHLGGSAESDAPGRLKEGSPAGGVQLSETDEWATSVFDGAKLELVSPLNTPTRPRAANPAPQSPGGQARGSPGGRQEEVEVAVKLFRDAKTSDGDPADEMAATAVAGSAAAQPGCSQATGCPHLMRSFGRLPPGAAKQLAASLLEQSDPGGGGGGGEGTFGRGDLGLALEFLDGYEPLGGPPSLSSVTRDVYPGDDPLPKVGKGRTPRFGLGEVCGVLESVGWAAAALHSLGISHSDLYAHNTLLRPGAIARRPPPPLPGGKPSGEVTKEGDGWAVLSDLGAAWFYKDVTEALESGAPPPPPPLASSPAGLVERVEVLAFAHMAEELLDRSRGDTGAGAAPAARAALERLARDCAVETVAARPAFAQVLERVREARALYSARSPAV
mmetsp:Transcript_58451/g.132357  ORF Transcript_58451/g.132357 Transcript_58451/m.132357 type:complete len:684 (+) Transcript_58451:73-2124(+)